MLCVERTNRLDALSKHHIVVFNVPLDILFHDCARMGSCTVAVSYVIHEHYMFICC